MRRLLTLPAACGLASSPPTATATGIPAPGGGWTGPPAARSLPTLSRPAGLAVGARGNVFVADTGNHRIVEIAPDGYPVATSATPTWGRTGRAIWR